MLGAGLNRDPRGTSEFRGVTVTKDSCLFFVQKLMFLVYARPLDTIVMDPKLKSYIVEDAKEFFASESWYAERGLPFRRGVR